MPGAVNVFIGEGRTAEVLRNLCYQIVEGSDGDAKWVSVARRIEELFGIVLDRPILIEGRGEIEMSFRNRNKTQLDLSASGRGLQQTLLLMAYLTTNPGSVLLLDEPDAHLEILRQRQIYRLLTEVANENKSQIVAASHSEVILNEAADRDVVVAFVGRPHRIDDRGSQVYKSLKSIGFEHYYQAEITGWVLYLRGGIARETPTPPSDVRYSLLWYLNEIARRIRYPLTAPSSIMTSCRRTSAMRRSRTDLAAVCTALAAAASHDSVLVPMTSVTR